MDGSSPLRETRLSRELRRAAPSRKATPRDAFALALKKWLGGNRVEIGALAEELGVNRATVFRWIGSRELLLGEVIWHVFSAAWTQAVAGARGQGADFMASFTRGLMDIVLASDAFRTFIAQDPEYVLNLLTSSSSTVQARILEATCAMLEEQARAGHIVPALEIKHLAFILVRIVESCLYGDQITGRQPSTAVTSDAIRVLVAAKPTTA